MIERTIGGRRCHIFTVGEPECVILQPVQSLAEESLPSEADLMARGSGRGFVFAAFEIGDWNRELSPWRAPPPRGREWFGNGAGGTLRYVEDVLLPAVRPGCGSAGVPVMLGGYSLAGLFSLWAGTVSESFSAVVGASPSVWLGGWIGYAKRCGWNVRAAYLSLGDTEHETRNAMLSRSRACIEETFADISRAAVDCTLEWNPGGHFVDAAQRTARGFVWAIGRILGDSLPATPSGRPRCCGPCPRRRRRGRPFCNHSGIP